jgi:hypothetical protein
VIDRDDWRVTEKGKHDDPPKASFVFLTVQPSAMDVPFH